MPFTLLDGILIFVMLISAVLAMIRGFTREVFSIGSWVAAAAVTYFTWQKALPFTQRYIQDDHISLGVTVAGIFFVTLLAVSLITMRISDFVLDSKAGPLDRTLGFVFGAARGLVLMIVAFLFLNFFIPVEREPTWIANAASRPWLTGLGQDLMNRLPDDPEAEILERLRGDKPTEASVTTPPTDAPADAPAAPILPRNDEETPADEPGIAPDDQNQLERQLQQPSD